MSSKINEKTLCNADYASSFDLSFLLANHSPSKSNAVQSLHQTSLLINSFNKNYQDDESNRSSAATQCGVNQLGGAFHNGKPLPFSIRYENNSEFIRFELRFRIVFIFFDVQDFKF